MALDREKGVIHNINRIVIAGITIAASLIDGYSLQDFLYGVAVIIWLWLPESDRLEARLLMWFRSRKVRKKRGVDRIN